MKPQQILLFTRDDDFAQSVRQAFSGKGAIVLIARDCPRRAWHETAPLAREVKDFVSALRCPRTPQRGPTSLERGNKHRLLGSTIKSRRRAIAKRTQTGERYI
jgi:hypothetical protein